MEFLLLLEDGICFSTFFKCFALHCSQLATYQAILKRNKKMYFLRQCTPRRKCIRSCCWEILELNFATHPTASAFTRDGFGLFSQSPAGFTEPRTKENRTTSPVCAMKTEELSHRIQVQNPWQGKVPFSHPLPCLLSQAHFEGCTRRGQEKAVLASPQREPWQPDTKLPQVRSCAAGTVLPSSHRGLGAERFAYGLCAGGDPANPGL